MDTVLAGTLVSLIAGCAMGVGGAFVYVVRRPSDRTLDTLRGFGAGVMLAAVCFGLTVPAVDLGGIRPVIAGIAAGAALVMFAERAVAHMHFGGREVLVAGRTVFLAAAGAVIRSLSAGVAVGAAFGRQGALEAGWPIAIGIGAANIAEGLPIVFVLVGEECKRGRAIGIVLCAGGAAGVGGLVSVSVVSFVPWLLPAGLAFAAGAMLYVVFEEIVPETYAGGSARPATMGLVAGFMLMLMLESVAG
ncbi:zinc transporter ZupT [Anaerohalosphaera lusitana]|uniref:Zinc transporter ZupT n=1 Tax=Anaerohalosphaera lusitana TaxID=1936003 RepID=A0A1U9NKJ8_9BACT|nr:ZIP family metal transporter [Anaerohalosphaera lusitana]AQT68429.1 zinc transporter ZupT [Anaerohalosphaera lusitana]